MGGFDRRDFCIGGRHNRFYTTLPVMLCAGVRYALIGVCDDDCDDLHFRLFDATGREVACDADPDDAPVVKVMPGRTQVYQLRVIMASRTAEPCSFGVGLYASD